MGTGSRENTRYVQGIVVILFLTIICSGYLLQTQHKKIIIDKKQYPKGFPRPVYSALQQLQHYPSPRFKSDNKLIRLFNWMDPYAMGGNSQKGVTPKQATKNACDLQEELALNWNYNIVIPNSSSANSEKALESAGNPTLAYIELANKYPQIPLGVVTFWMQVKPVKAGYKSAYPMILGKDLKESNYTHFNWNGRDKKEINFNFPDSLIDIDAKTQKYFLEIIVKHLTRPIDIINENGEEPPGYYMMKPMMKDSAMIKRKQRSGIKDWTEFMSVEKLRMRERYISTFMKEVPELKNTLFTIYANEGGPIDKFDWNIMKKCMNPINGNYYSTPDFYPRWPINWKAWRGAWHGWKWIAEGRQVELKHGDNLFSPYVCAGWSKDQKEDIRPGQWLGLLKCLAGAGAEFYYVGYFNLSVPYTDPRQYVWQAAMASYAQGITSRYETELRNSHLLVDEKGKAIVNIEVEGEPCLLLVVRKCDDKKRYIINATMQPFNNNKNSIPDKKIIHAEFDGNKLSFEARRQGSVYVYDVSNPGDTIFYQLDAWHESSHPDHWTKDFYFEAEVQDGSTPLPIHTIRSSAKSGDFSEYTSFIKINPNESAKYDLCFKDTLSKKYIHLFHYTSGTSVITLNIDGKKVESKKLEMTPKTSWITIDISSSWLKKGTHVLEISCEKGSIHLDKFVISSSPEIPVNNK